MLTAQQATQLLARVGDVEVLDISVAATINDVFRVVTRSHGVFFIKFHTARWYADQPDTAAVAAREAAMHELLCKRGLPLPYTAWADTSRSIVSRSVFICRELEGTAVTEAAAQFPAASDDIMRALGRYLRCLHEIEFTTPGILHRRHAELAASVGVVPHVESWDDHPLHHPEHFQRESLAAIARAERGGSLPRDIAAELTPHFARRCCGRTTTRPASQWATATPITSTLPARRADGRCWAAMTSRPRPRGTLPSISWNSR